MATIEKRGRMYYSRARIGGRVVHRALHRDRRIAQEMLLGIIKEGRVAGGAPAIPSNTGWDGFKARYLAWSEGVKAKYTRAHDKRALANLEAFRTIYNLEEVTPHLLEDFRLHQKKAGKNAPVINREVQSLKSIMRWGESRNLVARQDWSVCGKWATPKNRIDFYTPAEFAKLLEHCGTPEQRRLAYLGARMGLRQTEMFMARLEDIDWKANTITIRPHDGWVPKTAGSTRTIPMAADLRAELEPIRKSKRKRILEDENGWMPSSANSMGAEFHKNVVVGAGFGNRGRLHILRHTFASHLAQAGVPLYTISKLLGHSSIRQTECYAHLCPNSLSAAVDLLPIIPIK